MKSNNRYSAKEVSDIISSSKEFEISARTVNYYVFDKKLFNIDVTGKKAFTDKEIDKIRGILILKKYTNFTLDQIKEIINRFTILEIEKKFEKVNVYENIQNLYMNSVSSYDSSDCHNIHPNTAIEENANYANTYSNTMYDAATISTADENANSVNSITTHNAVTIPNKSRTIKINDDITLFVSGNIDNIKLKQIIEIIKILN